MDIDFLQSAATRSSGPRSESPRGSENASAKPHQTYFVPRSEAPTNASPDQLLALLVALAAEINSSDSIRDSNALENVVNKDVGISNIHTAFVGNGSSFSVRAWRFDRPERSLVFKSAMPSDYKFTHREERRRLADIILELRALSHPALRGQKNIVELLGLGWETDSFEQARKWPVLILEYADGGTLTNLLHREHISLLAKLRICHDIACGLTALHEVGIIHGDVKPQNILMFQGPSSSNAVKSWVAKLGDFGGAIVDASDNDVDVLRTGTQPWNAPEWKAEMRAIDMKRTDIYSFGLVIWSIAADGVDPFIKSTEIFSLPPGIVDIQARYKAIEVLKRDGSGFLAKLLDAGRSNFFSELNGRLVERLLTLTIQSEPTLRDLEKVTAILAEETGRSTVAPVLKQWQREPQGLEDMLLGPNDLDTLDPVIRMYVKKRLQDSYERSPEAWQRRSAAFNLAIESLSDSEPGKATKDCLDWLLKAAEMGNQSAQSIVYRFHITLIQTIPVDIFPQVKAWVMEAAARGYPAALEDMISLASPEECRLVKERLRCRYAGIGQNRFASLYAALEATLGEGDTDIQEHLARKFQAHSDSHDFNMALGGGDNVLHFAASAGFLSVINLWHQPRPIDINSKGYGGETALLHACRAGHYEVTIALLGMGSDPTIACNNGDTPLHWLLSFNTQKVAEIASKLRAKGANPNAVAKSVRFSYASECNYEAGTPLHRAVERGNLAAVHALLSIGAEADHSGGRPDAYTPLNVAAFLHRAEILGILLSSLSEPEPAAAVYAGMSLLAPAIGGEHFHGERFSKIARHGPSWWSQTSRTLEVLLEHGAEKHLHGFPAESIGAGVTTLFVATTQGDAKVVEYFLTHGSLSDINVSSRYYPSDTLRSPLQKATSSRRNESFAVLLQHGADPCASHLDENGDRLTYLYECASSGHSDHSVAEQLVSRGVPVDEPGPADYETPFACAVRNRSFALASWLVQQGANPHVEYSRGFMFEMGYSHSLLGVLIAEQSLSTLVCIDYLFGIVPQPKFVVASIRDYTALHAVARIKEAGRDDIALHLILLRLIEGFKPTTAQINQISQDGYTALHFAVINANANVARTLLENGADPFIKNHDEFSSFDYIQVTLPHVDEDPASYIDASDPRPEEDQVRLARGRREGILRLLTEHSNKPNDSNHSS